MYNSSIVHSRGNLNVVVLLDGNEFRWLKFCGIMILFENGIEGRQSPCIQHPHTTTQLSLNCQTTQTQCAVNGPKGLKIHLQGAA